MEKIIIKVSLVPLEDAVEKCFTLYLFNQYSCNWNRKLWLEALQNGHKGEIKRFKDCLKQFYFLNPEDEQLIKVLKEIKYEELKNKYGKLFNDKTVVTFK